MYYNYNRGITNTYLQFCCIYDNQFIESGSTVTLVSLIFLFYNLFYKRLREDSSWTLTLKMTNENYMPDDENAGIVSATPGVKPWCLI